MMLYDGIVSWSSVYPCLCVGWWLVSSTVPVQHVQHYNGCAQSRQLGNVNLICSASARLVFWSPCTNTVFLVHIQKLGLLLFRLWLEFWPGEKSEKHFLVWQNLHSLFWLDKFLSGLVWLGEVYRDFTMFTETSAQCAAKSAICCDLLKIKTIQLMTNFNQWQASMRALPYPHRHIIDTAFLGCLS